MADYRKVRASTWRSWLDGLPEEIYDKRDTAHIVRLMDALCGNGGVNTMRKSLLLKRLQTSLYETRYCDLDTVYSSLFDLPRLSSEQYEYREDALLLWSEIQEMNIKDAHYRERIWNYMLSFQYGGTVKGLELAATAAVGIPCEVVDGCIYFSAAGVPQSDQGGVSGLPINFDGTVDFNGATIVVMTGGELTAEQQYNLSMVTERLRPVDVHYTFMTRDELMRLLAFHDIDDEVVKPMSCEASSRWWRVVRTVTGRPDWVVGGFDGDWIEPNVPKEAPQKLLVNSQEGEYDFTQMVKSARASSEHVGRYGAKLRSLFPSLGVDGSEMPKAARNAVSQASSRNVTSGYYGDGFVIDGAYPIEYSNQLTSFFSEDGRSKRFWSSDEREGGEWLEVELKRTVPINFVSMSVFKKPVKVRLFFSSFARDDGERVWNPARDDSGRQLTYTNPEWGGGGDELAVVDFYPLEVVADAVRIEFERLDIPHYTQIGVNAYEEDDFDFSVELADLSVKYVVRSEEEFVSTTYEDMFGNRVDTAIATMDAGYAIDGEPDTFWVSQPNLGESAVEYVVIKLSDEPVRVNFMDVDAVYAGCQMNVYSSDEAEPVEWTPYPQVYSLRSGRYELPMRKVTHIKLEFTTLCAIPYETNVPKVFVETRRFPWDVRDYCEKRFTSDYEISREQALLMSQDEAFYDDGSVKNRLGVEDEYVAEDRLEAVKPFYGYSSLLNDNTMFKRRQDSPLVEFYGDDLAREVYMRQAPDAMSFGGPSPTYRFNEICEHEYDVESFERTDNLAYVVGLKDVSFGFSGRVLSMNANDAVFMYMQDDRFVYDNDGWEFVNGERAKVGSESLNSLETVDVQSVYPFRTFEFSVNQKPPVEKFEYPSNMVEEWHGLNSSVEAVDFGTSGTVMMMTGSEERGGIESESKLTRSMAIANVQVDVFPNLSGEWVLECGDMFGESVFTSSYQLPARKWSTVGMNFVPMPGGNWWDRDYPYRVRIPLAGPLAKGQAMFVPVIDFEALVDDGIIDENLERLRLIYFNGVDTKELDVDITDNMELWFEIQQDLPSGSEANGAYDFDRGVFFGAYYIYLGERSGVLPDEDEQPMRDYRKVFEPVPYEVEGAQVGQDGTSFENEGDMAVFDDGFYLPDKGFLSFEFEPSDNLHNVSSGTEGVADVRFLLDYDDGGKKVQFYTYEKQMFFVIVDSDGFESSFVSKLADLLTDGSNSRVLVEWGARGSAQVMEVDPLDPTQTSVNPGNENRRAISLYVDSATARECIPNVYDEKHYMDSDKVY